MLPSVILILLRVSVNIDHLEITGSSLAALQIIV